MDGIGSGVEAGEQLNITIMLTAKEVGKILDMEPNEVYYLVRRGRLPYVRVNRAMLFDEAEIYGYASLLGHSGSEIADRMNQELQALPNCKPGK